jgi:hypothetical protein
VFQAKSRLSRRLFVGLRKCRERRPGTILAESHGAGAVQRNSVISRALPPWCHTHAAGSATSLSLHNVIGHLAEPGFCFVGVDAHEGARSERVSAASKRLPVVGEHYPGRIGLSIDIHLDELDAPVKCPQLVIHSEPRHRPDERLD